LLPMAETTPRPVTTTLRGDTLCANGRLVSLLTLQ